MGTSSLAYLTAEVCASSALLHCGLVWYGLALCSMVQFGLVCELCTSCAAHQRPRQCGHNLFAPPLPSYPCLWNTRVCRIQLHPSCLLFLHSEAVSIFGWYGIFSWSVWVQIIAWDCNGQHHSTCTNFSFFQPKSGEVHSGTSQPWIWGLCGGKTSVRRQPFRQSQPKKKIWTSNFGGWTRHHLRGSRPSVEVQWTTNQEQCAEA